MLQTYNLSLEELLGRLQRNDMLIAAGAIETGSQRIVPKVAGLIETLEDAMEGPS